MAFSTGGSGGPLLPLPSLCHQAYPATAAAASVLPWPDPAEVKAVAFPLGRSSDPLPPLPPPSVPSFSRGGSGGGSREQIQPRQRQGLCFLDDDDDVVVSSFLDDVVCCVVDD